MINYKKALVKALDNVLPTYEENFVDSSTQTPCITYFELSNVASEEGDNIRYSNIAFRIKVWGRETDNKDIYQYSDQIDKLMFSLGFKRTGYRELYIDSVLQLIFTYQCRAVEKY